MFPYGGAVAPAGYLLCDGAAVSRTTYAALFVAIGTAFGAGDGSTTFNLPDARGRALIGAGQGTGLTNRALAATVGAETHTLDLAEIPSHTHLVNLSTLNGGGTRAMQGTATTSGTGATTAAGGGAAHNNMQPSVAVNFIIKT